MPNIKSAIKRVKVTAVKRAANASAKSALRTTVKNFNTTVEKDDVQASKDALISAIKKLDKAASQGLIHKNAASRKKSRLMKKFNAAQ